MLAALFTVHAGLFYLAGRVPKLFFFYIETMSPRSLILWKVLLLVAFLGCTYVFFANAAFWMAVALLVGVVAVVRRM